MTENVKEIVLTIDSKRFIAISILTLLTIASVGSYIIALLAFHSPTKELRWETDSTTEYWGYFDTAFNPGEQVTVIGTLIEGDDYWDGSSYVSFTDTVSIRWIVVVKDPNGMPIHMATGLDASAEKGVTLPDVDFNLPSDAVSGAYKIRVMAWTDWLPSGDTRTVHVNEVAFTVS